MNGCVVNWPAFGIEAPEGSCSLQGLHRMRMTCVHEHIHEGWVCDRHLGYIRRLLPLEQWHCGLCLRGESGHQCPAPVLVLSEGRELPGRAGGGGEYGSEAFLPVSPGEPERRSR